MTEKQNKKYKEVGVLLRALGSGAVQQNRSCWNNSLRAAVDGAQKLLFATEPANVNGKCYLRRALGKSYYKLTFVLWQLGHVCSDRLIKVRQDSIARWTTSHTEVQASQDLIVVSTISAAENQTFSASPQSNFMTAIPYV